DQYRSFSIAETTDDTDSLYQVLTRRLAHVDRDEAAAAAAETAVAAVDPADGESPVVTERKRPRFAYRPQLLVVDGGAPQVAAAARALEDAGHAEIALCGIAKRLEEIWLPGEDFPVILPRTSEALYLIQRLRDEAHRFAITHQRKRRKRDISTVLGEVPGLGDARIKALLRHFGSVAALSNASADEMTALPGIGPKLAAAIEQRLANR
ncbi:helix-hairpin-helix domain-containing protein, partial [Microbacterium sp. B24]